MPGGGKVRDAAVALLDDVLSCIDAEKTNLAALFRMCVDEADRMDLAELFHMCLDDNDEDALVDDGASGTEEAAAARARREAEAAEAKARKAEAASAAAKARQQAMVEAARRATEEACAATEKAAREHRMAAKKATDAQREAERRAREAAARAAAEAKAQEQARQRQAVEARRLEEAERRQAEAEAERRRRDEARRVEVGETEKRPASSASVISKDRLTRSTRRLSSFIGIVRDSEGTRKGGGRSKEVDETIQLDLEATPAHDALDVSGGVGRHERQAALRKVEEDRRRSTAALDYERFRQLLPLGSREAITKADWRSFQRWMRAQPFYSDALGLEDYVDSFDEWASSDEYLEHVDDRRRDMQWRIDRREWEDESHADELKATAQALAAWLKAHDWVLGPPRPSASPQIAEI